MVLDGYPWLLSVIYGCGWLSMVMECYPWLSSVIIGYNNMVIEVSAC